MATDFNLKKLEELGGATGTADSDLLLVNIDNGDGTYESKFISSLDLLRTGNLRLQDASGTGRLVLEVDPATDVSDIQTQEDANKVILELLKLLQRPAVQFDGATGIRGLVYPDETFQYSADGKLSVIIPEVKLAEGGATGATGIAGIMFPNDTMEYNNETGELGVIIPDVNLAVGGATGATQTPGIMFPNDTLFYNNDTGELGVEFQDVPLAEGGSTGATGIPGIMFPNDSLEYNNTTGELGVIFPDIPEVPLAEGGSTGATGVPGLMFPNDSLEYNNSTGELGVVFPEVPNAVQEISGSTGIAGLMFPNEQFVYDGTDGKLEPRNAKQGATGVDGRPGVMFPDSTLRYNPTTGEVGVDIPSGTNFVGVIGTGTGQVEDPSGSEDPGDFYIVGEALILNGTWDPAVGGEDVDVGDIVILDDSGNWTIIPAVLTFGVVQIISGTPALEVDDATDSQRPVLTIEKATPGSTGMDGLMSKEDKQKLDELDDTLLNYLTGATSSTDNLTIDFTDPQVPNFSIDGYLTGATSATEALDIDFTDPDVPEFSVANVIPSMSGASGMDGLMSKEDKEKLDKLEVPVDDCDFALTAQEYFPPSLNQKDSFGWESSEGKLYFHIDIRKSVKAAYDKGELEIDGVTYVINGGSYLEDSDSTSHWAQIELASFPTLTNGSSYTFTMPCADCCYDDYWLRDEIKQDQDRQDDELESSIEDLRNEIGTEYVKKTGDRMTGDLVIRPGSLKTYVVDSELDFDLFLQRNGSTKLTLGATESVFADSVVLQTEGSNDNHAVTKKYIDDEDNLIKDELVTIENNVISLQEEIDVLRNTVSKGNYNFDDPSVSSGPPNSGTFYLQTDASNISTSYGNVTIVGVSKTDLDGVNHTLSEIAVDDIVSFFDRDDSSFGAYRIVTILDDQTTYAIYEVETMDHFGNPSNPVRAFFYKQITGSFDDDEYVRKTGDNIQGTLIFDTNKKGIGFEQNGFLGFALDKTFKIGTGLNDPSLQSSIELTSAATIFKTRPVHYGLTIDEDTHITNKLYVDTQVDKKVSKTGDTMSGALVMDNTNIQMIKSTLKFMDYDFDPAEQAAYMKIVDLSGTKTLRTTVQENYQYEIKGHVADKSQRLIFFGDDELQVSQLRDPIGDTDAVNLRTLENTVEEIESLIESSIDDIDLDYLPLTGGTLTGKLTSSHTSNARVDFRSATGSSNADIQYNGSMAVSIQSDKVKVSRKLDLSSHKIVNVTDPASNQDAATKKYVDDRIPEEGTIPVQTTARTGVGQMWLNPNDNVLYIKKS